MERAEILAAFNFRHACKEFDKGKMIPSEEFELILEAARLSPSSFGFEPWKFLVVQNPAYREKLKAGAWGATLKLDTASHFVVALCRKADMRYDSDYIQYMMRDVQHHPQNVIETRASYFKAFQEKDFDLTDERKLFDWAAKQAYIALGNMMTVAALRGIDSCPIEGFDQQQTNGQLADHFGIDTTQFGVAYMVAFGYRIAQPQPKTRKLLAEIVQTF
jgi:nitroreductase